MVARMVVVTVEYSAEKLAAGLVVSMVRPKVGEKVLFSAV